MSAGDRERDDNTITFFQCLAFAASFNDHAHKLVAEDVAFLHCRDVAIVEMQIGTTDGRGCDADNRVTRIEYLRIRHVQDAHIVFTIPAESFHDLLHVYQSGKPACLPDSVPHRTRGRPICLPLAIQLAATPSP